jgi:RHS repeat-associated protein
VCVVGLDYADQRYYVPGAGRFMTADPYRASAGPSDPGSWNRYAYTQGDPINNTDSSGLMIDASTGDSGGGSPFGWFSFLLPGFGGGVPGGYAAYFDRLVQVNAWKRSPQEKVREWDLKIAAALVDASRIRETEPLRHVPHHLQVLSDCYKYGIRQRTYEVQDEFGNAVAGRTTVQEYVHVTEGTPTSKDTPFNGNKFVDNIAANLQKAFTFYQQFEVQVWGVNATDGLIPIMVRELDGRDYGTLGVHADGKGTVFINGNDGKTNGRPNICP